MSAKLGKYRTLCCTALLFAFLIAVRITFIHLTLSSADVTIENSSAIMSIMSTSERKGRKVAVVYARPTFHEEVVNAVTCTLHDLGYFTVVYIGSGIHLNGFAIPYLYQDRLDDSSSFYGNCVDKWIVVPISGPIFKSNGSSRRQPTAVENIPMDTSLIVFTTFPMMVNINTFDIFNKFKHIDNTSSQPILTDTYAMSIIQFMRDHATATNAIFIVHRVTDIFNSSQSSYISTMLGEDRSTFRFVSKHTRDTFLLMCRTKNDYKSNHICNCASDYFYPLPSLKMKLNMNENVDYDPMTKGNNNNNNNNDNNNNIINNNNNNNKCTSKDSTRKATISFAVQGRFGGKYADRRDPQSVISCLQKIEKSTKSTINVSITFIGNNFFDQKSRGQFGHLQSGDVRYISRLKYDDYYRYQ